MDTSDLVLAVIEPDINPHEVVERAAWLAELAGAPLELLFCDADVSSLNDAVFVSNEARDSAARIRAAQEAMIEELAEPARRRGLRVTTSILDQRPVADGVVYVALDRNPGIVMKGTRYHSHAERAIFVDTDWQLLHACPFPLWLVKPHPFAARPTIIAAVDPTHGSEELAKLDRSVVARAQEISGRTGGELQLLHSFEPLKGIGRAATRTFKPVRLSVAEVSEHMAEEHREHLEALAAANAIDDSHTHLLPGSPLEVLPYVAREWNADLVVMGAIVRSGRKRMALGNTAEQVLDHLPCDILVIRPDD